MPSTVLHREGGGQGDLTVSSLLDVLKNATVTQRIELCRALGGLMCHGEEPGIRVEDYVEKVDGMWMFKGVTPDPKVSGSDWARYAFIVASRVRTGQDTVEQVIEQYPMLTRKHVLAAIVACNREQPDA